MKKSVEHNLHDVSPAFLPILILLKIVVVTFGRWFCQSKGSPGRFAFLARLRFFALSQMPCAMTGIENPAWEEKYVFGYDTETEHETLKKAHPSCADDDELKRFEGLIDEGLGILVKVKPVTDNRRFILDLALLRATDATSKNYRLPDDYSVWFGNRSRRQAEHAADIPMTRWRLPADPRSSVAGNRR